MARVAGGVMGMGVVESTVRNPGSITGALISSANALNPVLAKYIGGGV